MHEPVAISREGGMALLTIQNPPVNALSPGVPEAIREGVRAAAADPAVKAILLRGGGRTFSAGADIREFEKVGASPSLPCLGELNRVFSFIEESPKPIVAAIHGSALGGGLELAMACHYRVALADAQVGQPEVRLGLVPGGGATQRLPRLVGIPRAALMCAGGDPVPAPQARDWGLIDRVVEGDLLAGALAFLREGRLPRRTRDLGGHLPGGEPSQAWALAARERRGPPAVRRVIELVEATRTGSFEEGLQREAAVFFECLRSAESRAMIHLFFAEREARKSGLLADRGVGPVGDRVFRAYVGEAEALVREGADPGAVDQALVAFGMARGPLEGRDPPRRPSGGRTLRAEEIVERTLDTLVNEGARAVEEGQVGRASDIDALSVLGYGFPPTRGGPLWYGDGVGLRSICGRLKRPARLLQRLADEGRTFADLDAGR